MTLAEGGNAMATPSGGSGSEQVRRKRYWVLPKLQLRFIRLGWLVAASAVVATTLTWGILLILWSSLANQVVSGGPVADAGQLFWAACLRVFATTGCLIVVFGLVAFLAGLVVSHRVAGPLYRLGRIAQEVAAGRDDPAARRITLRPRDYIHEFADQFGEMLGSLSQRAQGYREVLSALHDRLSDLEGAVADGKAPPEGVSTELREALRVIREARVDSQCGEENPGAA